jgi:hypothetical protein
MRTILKLAFLVFYLASSYAITQERTVMIAGAVQHSSAKHDQTQVDKNSREAHDGFPNYRQAKPKTGAGINFRQTPAVFVLDVCSETLETQSVSFKALFSLECSLSRAPPVQLW